MDMITEVPTILIVDDVPENLELLISHLDQYQTIVAKDGVKAIERAEKQQPDLILMDIQMPEMDGYEACRRLKAMESTKDIPLIFMTALHETENKIKGFELGAVDYITKPIDVAELLARVNTHLTLHTMRRELQEKNHELELNALRQKRVQQVMRHDLKSPLQAIITAPELLRMDANVSDYQSEIIQIIDDASHSMLNMINSSLQLYKIESGTYVIQPEDVDLIKVIKKITSTIQRCNFEYFYNRKPIEDGAHCIVKAEELLVYTLFSNLIKNADEASSRGDTITISINTTVGTKVIITNKGSVSESIREHFFEEFTTSGKEQGTGLGTYSAKLITETLGGTIKLDSSVPDQTTLIVSFP